jgi:hypothetical protein
MSFRTVRCGRCTGPIFQGCLHVAGIVFCETRYQPPGTGALTPNGADPPLHAQKEAAGQFRPV